MIERCLVRRCVAFASCKEQLYQLQRAPRSLFSILCKQRALSRIGRKRRREQLVQLFHTSRFAKHCLVAGRAPYEVGEERQTILCDDSSLRQATLGLDDHEDLAEDILKSDDFTQVLVRTGTQFDQEQKTSVAHRIASIVENADQARDAERCSQDTFLKSFGSRSADGGK